MSIITVGVGKQYSTIAAAVAHSMNGDVIKVNAGTYVNDFVTVNTKITLQGIGGMVNMVATVPPPNGKAIMTTNTDVTIDHFAFSGAKVADMNGAGIRYQGGALVITNSYFHDNQDGLLAAAVPGGTISISNTEFSHNGAGDGKSHNLYVNKIASLTITNSYFHDAVVGHEIKSRADNTTITGTRIFDGPTGTASYSVDLPNGGHAVLSNNIIEQGPKSQNPAIVHFGGEGNDYAGSSLTMTNNTLLNDLHSGSAALLLNQTAVTAQISGTSVFGLTATQMAKGLAAIDHTTLLATEPHLNTASPIQAATPGLHIIGTAGADMLTSGAGNDTMTGGAGADHFIFGASNNGTDLITDFHVAEGDRLDLHALLGGISTSLATLEAGGYLKLQQTGVTVQVLVDPHGGAKAYVDLVDLPGNTIAGLGHDFILL
jgi:Ca2+-binding RTX toxin-like protein